MCDTTRNTARSTDPVLEDALDDLIADRTTAEQMVRRIADSRPRPPAPVERDENPPASLLRAQTAIRRINRGRH